MKQTTKLIFSVLFISTIYSCQKSDTNDLQDAQLCLNTAAAGEAMDCVSKISSNTSENAYKLRCSAVFIANNFGAPTSFISAMDQIKNGGNNAGCTGTCSGSLAAMSTLNFGTTSNSTAAANLAFSECSASGVGIYSQISSIFKIGTLLSTTAGSTDIGNLETAAAALTGASAQVVGEVVQVTYAASCSDTTNASDSTKQYCAELSAAISGGATAQAIGECLLKKMSDPAYVCP
jgi:hypothetical protein